MILLWIISVPLCLFGLWSIFGNCLILSSHFYAKLQNKKPFLTGSMLPVGGIVLGIGFLLLPLAIPNHLLIAGFATLLDPWTWMMLYLPFF